MTLSQITERQMLKYVCIKKMWEPKEQIAFNLAHKVAKSLLVPNEKQNTKPCTISGFD
jgi:hypothetical protein